MPIKRPSNLGSVMATRVASVPRSALSMGAVGLAAGGVVAAMHNGYRLARGEVNGVQAVGNTVRDALGTGAATAVGAAAMTLVGVGGLAGLAGFMVVASVTKGAWDAVVDPRVKRIGPKPA